jgi:hypothetical protein
MPRIVGRVLKVEDVPPYVNRQTQQVERAGFTQLHVLEGVKVERIRIPQNFPHSMPKQDDEVSVEVAVRPYVQRGGQSAAVSYTAEDFHADSGASNGRRVASVPSPAAAGH